MSHQPRSKADRGAADQLEEVDALRVQSIDGVEANEFMLYHGAPSDINSNSPPTRSTQSWPSRKPAGDAWSTKSTLCTRRRKPCPSLPSGTSTSKAVDAPTATCVSRVECGIQLYTLQIIVQLQLFIYIFIYVYFWLIDLSSEDKALVDLFQQNYDWVELNLKQQCHRIASNVYEKQGQIIVEDRFANDSRVVIGWKDAGKGGVQKRKSRSSGTIYTNFGFVGAIHPDVMVLSPLGLGRYT